jgi:hypothetical protein
MENPLEKKTTTQAETKSLEQLDYIQSFDELATLGAPGFSGKEVTFQPVGRYDNERQKGTVRIWEEDPDLISIYFMGSKVGIPYPDSERITREDFESRKDILKIQLKNK